MPDEVNTEYKWVGKRNPRPDGVDKVTGRAKYGADLYLPGMLTGRFLRSPHAHARIKSIDTSAAKALAGVKAVVTSDDFPDIPFHTGPHGPMVSESYCGAYMDHLCLSPALEHTWTSCF